MSEFCPDWVAGISIGAINAALIAGNPPERRVERLREFWELASSTLTLTPSIFGSEALRPWFTELSASWIAAFGVPGFFSPRAARSDEALAGSSGPTKELRYR